MEHTTKKAIGARDIALMGMMLATIEAAKLALGFIPGVEIVTLLIILYTLFFEKKVLYIIPAFILVEGVIYGFGIWWFMYTYIWPLLIILVYFFRKQQSVWFWSIFAGFFGLFFGALCSIVYLFTTGPMGALTWWVAGIPTDILHGISNFILCRILFVPLKNLMQKLRLTLQ